ncbi:MAG: ABC transporter substrate-binding protein [Candidatus Tectimicrobiota bacterium]|nr:MAG: ABC transporter substrate-binding protein [Candidatus Tectomicrobia bacterium]
MVTTVAPLTDLVRQVSGDDARVHGLIPEGVNAHTFQPTPGDVRFLASADLIVLNGLFLEEAIERLVRASARPGVRVLKLAEATLGEAEWIFDFSFPRAQGRPNPHLWLDVVYAQRYVTLVREQLAALDPAHAEAYERRAAAYLAQLAQLHDCITAAVATIPPAQRVLLTYHDAWPYFARRYGLRVLGAIQPANFFEPSPREVARLIAQIRQAQVPAIFGAAVFPSKVLAQIAAETGVRYVSTLRDDTLPGAPGEPQHSYLGMMLANATAMVEALGGEAAGLAACRARLLPGERHEPAAR